MAITQEELIQHVVENDKYYFGVNATYKSVAHKLGVETKDVAKAAKEYCTYWRKYRGGTARSTIVAKKASEWDRIHQVLLRDRNKLEKSPIEFVTRWLNINKCRVSESILKNGLSKQYQIWA